MFYCCRVIDRRCIQVVCRVRFFEFFFCLFVFYFICIIYIFTYHDDVLDETTNTESDLGSASRDNDQYYYINIVLLIGRHGELVG
jgi:hypothetical protein